MVTDISAKEIEDYFFSGKGCRFRAEYGGKVVSARIILVSAVVARWR